MSRPGPSGRGQAASSEQASASTHSPIGPMRPVDSRIGTKRAGETGPESESQRRRASTPITLSSGTENRGW